MVAAVSAAVVVIALCAVGGVAILHRTSAHPAAPAGTAGAAAPTPSRPDDNRPGPLLAWSVTATDLPGWQSDPNDRPQFDSLVCPSARDCWANAQPYSGSPSSFVVHYDGTSWTRVPGAVPPPGRISCQSPVDCAGAGPVPGSDSGAMRPLRYDGHAWAPLGTVPAGDRTVLGVTCVDRSTCWAVGGSGLESGAGRPFVLRYDGSGWRDVPIPRVRDQGILTEISCPEANSCWAVGDIAGVYFTIVHFDGREWTEVPATGPPFTSANNGEGEPLLGNLQCASVSLCWAFGDWNGEGLPFAMRYDGSAWTLDRSGLALPSDGLNVTCTGARNCWAVGAVPDGPGTPRIVHWDGSSWREVTSPAPAFPAVLKVVACPTPTECWALGSGGGATGPAHPLIEHALPATGAPAPPRSAGATATATGRVRTQWTDGTVTVTSPGLLPPGTALRDVEFTLTSTSPDALIVTVNYGCVSDDGFERVTSGGFFQVRLEPFASTTAAPRNGLGSDCLGETVTLDNVTHQPA